MYAVIKKKEIVGDWGKGAMDKDLKGLNVWISTSKVKERHREEALGQMVPVSEHQMQWTDQDRLG